MYIRNKIYVVTLACASVSFSVLLSGYFLVYASLNSDLDDYHKDPNGVTQSIVTATHLPILKASDSSDNSRSSGSSSSKTTLEFLDVPLMDSTLTFGNLQIPYIGIETQSLTPDLARALNFDNLTRGEIVTGITPGSPAEKAGIKAMNLTEIPNSGAAVYTGLGDIVLTVDGSTSFATDFNNLEEYVYDSKRAGENITLTIFRDGQISDIEFYTGSRPEFQWYENTDKGLKLKYPTSWLVSDDESQMTEGRVIEFSPAESNGSKSTPVKPTVTVTVYPPSAADGTINFDGTNDNTNIRLLNSNTTTLANTHAYKTLFNDYSTDYPIKVLTVFAIKDMYLYRIDYSALLPVYEDYLDPAIEMIESFQFIK